MYKENATEIAVVLSLALYWIYTLITAPDPQLLFARMPNDAAMRLVGLRDVMAGQSWWDHTQMRLGTVEGVEIHWSRLVDAPILALMWLFDWVLPTPQAELFACLVWPMVTGGALVWVMYKLGRAMPWASPEQQMVAARFILVLTALFVIDQIKFKPGNIDHHHVQVLLYFTALWGFVCRHEHAGYALLSGAAIGLGLVVGFEFLVGSVLFCALVAALWLFQPEEEAEPTLRFCVGLVASLLIVTPFTAPLSAWRGGYCDAISIDLIIPAVIGALGLFVTNLLFSFHNVALRMGSLILVAVLAMGAAALFFPSCLENPLGRLDPYLVEEWLNKTGEAFSLGASLAKQSRWTNVGYFVLGVLAMIVSGWFFIREKKAEWLVTFVLILVTLLLTAYQIRSYIFLYVMTSVPLGYLVAITWVGRRPAARLVPLYLAALLVPMFWPKVLHTVYPLENQEVVNVADNVMLAEDEDAEEPKCVVPEEVILLQNQPEGVISAHSDHGANLLLLTPHRVLAAPYHRNQSGLLAQLRIIHAADMAEFENLLAVHGVDYVVACTDDIVRDTTLWYQLAHGEVKADFLVEMPVDRTKTTMRIFAVAMPAE